MRHSVHGSKKEGRSFFAAILEVLDGLVLPYASFRLNVSDMDIVLCW